MATDTTFPSLEIEHSNGIPVPSPALMVAFMATTMVGIDRQPQPADPEKYRSVGRDALAIVKNFETYEELRAVFMDIGERGKAMECPAYFGTGGLGTARNRWTCPACNGTGRRP
jgi:hypothetical protein